VVGDQAGQRRRGERGLNSSAMTMPAVARVLGASSGSGGSFLSNAMSFCGGTRLPCRASRSELKRTPTPAIKRDSLGEPLGYVLHLEPHAARVQGNNVAGSAWLASWRFVTVKPGASPQERTCSPRSAPCG
jgi:hypothetical protein